MPAARGTSTRVPSVTVPDGPAGRIDLFAFSDDTADYPEAFRTVKVARPAVRWSIPYHSPPRIDPASPSLERHLAWPEDLHPAWVADAVPEDDDVCALRACNMG